MNTEVTGLIREGGRVAGCATAPATDGPGELRADLTVGLRRPLVARPRARPAAAAGVPGADRRLVVPAAPPSTTTRSAR